MKTSIISAKLSSKNLISSRGWGWILVLYLCSVVYYREFFTWTTAPFLALFVTLVLVAMMTIGYRWLGSRPKFPVWDFILLTLAFSFLRYLYVYFFLSHHLPEYTIFHHRTRVLPSIVFGSGAMLFLGYSYAIYEWGLAAREKYLAKVKESDGHLAKPITLRSDGKTIYLLPQDIIYLKASGEYVDYHTVAKRYTCFKRLKTAEQELKNYGFLRTHRSYIINPNYLLAIGTKDIQLKNEINVPLSKKYKEVVQAQLPQNGDKVD